MLGSKLFKLEFENMSKDDLIKLTKAVIKADFTNALSTLGEIVDTTYSQVLPKALNCGGEVFDIKDIIKTTMTSSYHVAMKNALFKSDEAFVVEVATAFAFLEIALERINYVCEKMGSEIEETVKALGLTELGDVEPEPPEEK